MKTITICGSMKFEKEMPRIAFRLETKHGFNVLQCVYNYDEEQINPQEMELLRKAHYKKIDLSDAIYVVDIQGYIGKSVEEEMAYAKEHGKQIIRHSEFEF